MKAPPFLEPLLHPSSGPIGLRNQHGRHLASIVEGAFDSASRRKGLLTRSSFEPGQALVIAPCSGVHTFFMRFAIDVVFVSRDGAVVKVASHLRPWRVAGALRAFAAIELPDGTIETTGTRAGDRLEFVPASRPGTQEPAKTTRLS